jgi:hypothetical protein
MNLRLSWVKRKFCCYCLNPDFLDICNRANPLNKYTRSFDKAFVDGLFDILAGIGGNGVQTFCGFLAGLSAEMSK